MANAPMDSGTVEYQDFRGIWKVKDGVVTVICQSHGIPPGSNTAGAAPQVVADHILEKMAEAWQSSRR